MWKEASGLASKLTSHYSFDKETAISFTSENFKGNASGRVLLSKCDFGQSNTVTTAAFSCLNTVVNNPQMSDANGTASSAREILLMLSRTIEVLSFFNKDSGPMRNSMTV